MLLFDNEVFIEFETKFYFTYVDIALGNMFITTSGFIILLLSVDRYRAIVHPTWSRDPAPGRTITFALICSFMLQIPRFFEKHIVNRCVRVHQVNNVTLLGGKCQCGGAFSFLGKDCRYETEVEKDIVGSYPWIFFVVLSELIMKIIPAILLVFLNNRIIRKVKKTRAAVRRKCEDEDQVRARKIFRIFQRNKQIISKRDQNLIDLFYALYFSFLLTNLPMAVVRILSGCGFDEDNLVFHEFRILSNTLEALFASSNFYLYCLCNVQIRKKVPEQSSHDFCISVSLSTCQVLSWFKKLSPSQKKVRTISGRLGKEEDGRNSLLQ